MRELDGVTFWVVEDPLELSNLINTNIRREWESDRRGEGKNPAEDEWLTGLTSRKWRLEVVGVNEVTLNQELMGYHDGKTGYDFKTRLKQRTGELKRELIDSARVISPIILRGEDMQLMDGYCRFSALKEIGAKRAYAYVGSL